MAVHCKFGSHEDSDSEEDMETDSDMVSYTE